MSPENIVSTVNIVSARSSLDVVKPVSLGPAQTMLTVLTQTPPFVSGSRESRALDRKASDERAEIAFSREGRTGTRIIRVSTSAEDTVSTVSIVGGRRRMACGVDCRVPCSE
jgi:hypothetical protein